MPSSWTDNLIESPYGQYKFASATISAHGEISVVSRHTYSILDWLRDIGGLYAALMPLLHLSLSPFLSFNSSSFLMERLFRMRSENNLDLNKDSKQLDHVS